MLTHLATTTWVPKAENVILLGPPEGGKAHVGVGLGIKACRAGYPVEFDTVTGCAGRRAAAVRRQAHAHTTMSPERMTA